MYPKRRSLSLLNLIQAIPLVIVLLSILALLAFTILVLLVPVPAKQETPAGYLQNQALYVAARDGTKLAADVWLPPNLAAGERVPALIKPHRFWRADGIQGFGGRVLVGLGLERFLTPETEALTKAGYAVVLMDLRGSGASYGSRSSEFPPQDMDDLSDMLDWILLQPWSDGSAAAVGDGLTGMLVEKLTARGHPALKAAVLRFSPFDLYQDLAFPGGVFNAEAFQAYEEQKDIFDSSSICAARGWQGRLCRFGRFFLVSGVKPVGDDYDLSQLTQAVSQHVNQDLFERFSKITYRNDPTDRFAQTFSEASPYAYQQEVSASKIPLMVFVSWLDAGTADGAINRFLTLENSQQVIIGAWSHGGSSQQDPFLRRGGGNGLNQAGQLQMMIHFFDSALKNGSSQPPASKIRYYTLGGRDWQETPTWPPAGAETLQYYFSANGELSSTRPSNEDDRDLFSSLAIAASGENNRWRSFPDGRAVSYPDGVAREESYLSYLSPPLARALVITGAPQLEIFLSSNKPEQDLFVYLEAVDPSGKATYITEGLLRSRHQKNSDEPPYNLSGVYHPSLEGERMFLEESVPANIHISLLSTSAAIPEGYRLRIAITGMDASLTGSLAAPQTEFTIHRSQESPSNFVLPVFYPDSGE